MKHRISYITDNPNSIDGGIFPDKDSALAFASSLEVSGTIRNLTETEWAMLRNYETVSLIPDPGWIALTRFAY